MELSFLSEFTGDEQVFREVSGPGESFGLRVDGGRRLEETYCARMVAGALPPVIEDAARHPVVAPLAVTADAGIGAYIGVPVRLPDGSLYGTLCCLSHEPEPDLRDRDARFLEVLAEIVAEQLGREREEREHRRRLAERVEDVIRHRALGIVFQPIVALADRRPAGVEALARFAGEPYRAPDVWLADAWTAGRGPELELLAVRLALEQLPSVPDDIFVSVNVSPETVAHPELPALLGRARGRVVLEVTEHAVAEHHEELAASMARLRGIGARFAVDDVGAGYSGLNHVVRLAPDIIKLDRFLAQGVDEDPARQALASAAAAFGARARTRVIAEGVRTEEEHRCLLELGIRYGQGYHYGKPGPVHEILAAR